MKIALDDEVSSSIGTIPRTNLNALVNCNRSTIANDESTPSPNVIKGVGKRSRHDDRAPSHGPLGSWIGVAVFVLRSSETQDKRLFATIDWRRT